MIGNYWMSMDRLLLIFLHFLPCFVKRVQKFTKFDLLSQTFEGESLPVTKSFCDEMESFRTA